MWILSNHDIQLSCICWKRFNTCTFWSWEFFKFLQLCSKMCLSGVHQIAGNALLYLSGTREPSAWGALNGWVWGNPVQFGVIFMLLNIPVDMQNVKIDIHGVPKLCFIWMLSHLWGGIWDLEYNSKAGMKPETRDFIPALLLYPTNMYRKMAWATLGTSWWGRKRWNMYN